MREQINLTEGKENKNLNLSKYELRKQRSLDMLDNGIDANGWIVALAKNKETIEEVKEKINKYTTSPCKQQPKCDRR